MIFIGTNDFSAKILKNLIINKLKFKYVITPIPKKMGRGQLLKKHNVHITAEKNKIKIYNTLNINNEKTANFIKKIDPKIMIMIEYGEKINKNIIDIPTYGIINLHPSILPKLRGPTPIQNTIINEHTETGVTIIKINEKIDAGNILNVKKCLIKKNETYKSLSKKLIKIGTNLIIKTIKDIKNKNIKEYKQNVKIASYTKKFKPSYFKINWKDEAININKKIRAFYEIKKFSTKLNNIELKIIETKVIKAKVNDTPGKIIKIKKFGIDVITKKNILRIKKLQMPGKKINNIYNILNSKKNLFKIGNIFT